jgi:hypothetical protein
MNETQLKKQFTERDLQRVRNLIQKKEGDKTVVSVGYSKIDETHNEGEIWVDNGRTWTVKNGIKRNVRKVDTIALPLLCPSCSKPLNHHLDKRMYGIHQMCLKCVAKIEDEHRMNGTYEEYERNIILGNAKYFAESAESGLDDFLDDIINESYVMEDGTIQNWVGDGIDKVKIKQEILDKIQKIKDATGV